LKDRIKNYEKGRENKVKANINVWISEKWPIKYKIFMGWESLMRCLKIGLDYFSNQLETIQL